MMWKWQMLWEYNISCAPVWEPLWFSLQLLYIFLDASSDAVLVANGGVAHASTNLLRVMHRSHRIWYTFLRIKSLSSTEGFVNLGPLKLWGNGNAHQNPIKIGPSKSGKLKLWTSASDHQNRTVALRQRFEFRLFVMLWASNIQRPSAK